MGGRVRALAAMLLLAASGLAATSPAEADGSRTVDGDPADWVGASTGLGGTSQYSAGEFVHQDYVYDDYGAETRQRATQHGFTSPTRGDYRYPVDEDRYGGNSADIRELRFAATADDVYVLLSLNTLKELRPDATVLGLAIDTDPSGSTGGGDWPYGAGISTLGTDVVVTLWGDEGSVTPMPNGTPQMLVDVAVDTEANAIEARIPRDLVGGSQWKLHAATGLWDADGGTWMAVPTSAPTATAPGYGGAGITARAFNVAFRANEVGNFFEDNQANALAAGDISAFSADLDLDRLVGGADDPFVADTGRLYEVVMEQSFTIPPANEGHSYEGVPGRSQGIGGAALEQLFFFYGPHQPYALYVPDDYAGAPLPAALVLHGLGGAHCGFQCTPSFLSQMGESQVDGLEGDPMLLVSPLARGSSMYSDYGEQDVLEVLDDAFARVAIDPDRLYVMGYSMGGYGAFRFASLYPDRFAAAVSVAGYTGEFTGRYLYDRRHLGYPKELSDLVQPIVQPILGGERDRNINGDHVETADGLLHIPMLQLAGSNDEILPVTGQYAAAARLDDLGYRHRFDLYPGYEHLTFGVVADWTVPRAWLGTLERTTSPRRVVYRFGDSSIDPAVTPHLPTPLVHGRAYWVEALELRDGDHTKPSILGRINATSLAIAGTTHTVERYTEPALSPAPNVRSGISWGPGTDEPVANALDVALENIGRARISAAGASLDPSEPLHIDVTTDGEATLEVAGDFSGHTVTGADSTTDAGALVVHLPAAGTYSIEVTPSP